MDPDSTAGKTEIHRRKYLFGPFLVHELLGPDTPSLPLFQYSPPPPSLRGRAGQAQERGGATRGGRAARGADRQGRPSQHRGAAARLPPRGGGLLSLGFTRQVQSSGGGGAQPPTAAPAPAGADGGAHSPRSGQGRRSHIGRRPRSFRRAAIRWGGWGGVRALYICIQLYIDELSPANPPIPSIALASRT